MNWDEMTPFERDVLVAKEVMGRIKDDTDRQLFAFAWPAGNWHYTKSMSDAWNVVDKVQDKLVLDFHLERLYDVAEMPWKARFWSDLDCTRREWTETNFKAPEAICLAALRAVGVEV